MGTQNSQDNSLECEIQAPCFQALSADEVSKIKQGKTQVLFKKGETLTKQGTFSSYIFFVVKGLVKQYIEEDSGRNINLQIMQSGDFIGLSSLFEQPVFQYTTVAITDTVVYIVDKEAMKSVLKHNADFSFQIIMRHNEQTDVLYSVLRSIGFKQMNGRMADVLLYLNSLPYSNEEVFGNLSRKDIADFAGIATESAVKLLKSFEKDGLISLQDKSINILNKEKLVEIGKRG